MIYLAPRFEITFSLYGCFIRYLACRHVWVIISWLMNGYLFSDVVKARFRSMSADKIQHPEAYCVRWLHLTVFTSDS